MIALVIALISLITTSYIAATVLPNLNSITTNGGDADAANNNGKGNGKHDSDEYTTTYSPETTTSEPTTTTTTTTTSSTSSTISTTDDSNQPTVIVNKTHKYYYNITDSTYSVTCQCPTNTYGVINVNQTYHVGGYYGWIWYNDEFLDIHAKVGDVIKFIVQDEQWTGEDVWLVHESTYNDCDFGAGSGAVRLETAEPIRQDSEAHLRPGYHFLIQEWHLREWGNTLYFASGTEWDNPNSPFGCQNGVKTKVHIEDRTEISVILGDVSELDFSASETVQDLISSIGHISRMLILNQFSDEQRIRSEGDSGVTNVRGYWDGDLTYDDGSYSNGGSASIHDHSDNSLIVGIGEISAVLNGVEFTSRHNDYNLDMPCINCSEYNGVDSIERPDIPPSVLSQLTVEDEIIEMQEYFRAFKTQNISHRDYRSYFRAILCYIEGTWILDSSSLSEPFDSDRHSIDASTWKQLHDKIRWMMNSGRKDPSENLAHLPSSIRNLYNETFPIISNWEYRILCHPLRDDLPTIRFRVVDDLHIQLMGTPEAREKLYYSRRSRFDINKYIDISDINGSVSEPITEWYSGQKTWNFLDYLMEQIPGKNNYIANLTDELPDGTERVVHYLDNSQFNSGYYNRFYSLTGADAMGSTQHRRGYSDRYLFAAQNTQEKVSPISFEYEDKNDNTLFYPTQSRWSYAIPLEIIYMTPLTKWNPYNIKQYKDRNLFTYTSGECGLDPFIGYTFDNFYFTPIQFFTGIGNQGQGDTAAIGVCALSENDGNAYQVYPSGHWIIFPEIGNGVGHVRQRYPIFPIHYASHPAYKEVKALKDIILPKNYDDNINGVEFWTSNLDLIYGFDLILSGGGHYHIIHIPGWYINWIWYDENTQKYTNGSQYIIREDSTIANTHAHTVNIWRWRENDNTMQNQWKYEILNCRFGLTTDNQDIGYNQNNCIDGHNILYRD